jgi:hypothetical protein
MNEKVKPAEGGRAKYKGERLPPRPERDKANSPAPPVGDGIIDFQGLRFSSQ